MPPLPPLPPLPFPSPLLVTCSKQILQALTLPLPSTSALSSEHPLQNTCPHSLQWCRRRNMVKGWSQLWQTRTRRSGIQCCWSGEGAGKEGAEGDEGRLVPLLEKEDCLERDDVAAAAAADDEAAGNVPFEGGWRGE